MSRNCLNRKVIVTKAQNEKGSVSLKEKTIYF